MSNPIHTCSAGNARFARANPQKECGINSHHKWVTLNLALALNIFLTSLSLSQKNNN